MNARVFLVSIIFCMISVLLIGCTTTKPSRFYLLNALEYSQRQESQACQKDPPISLGIGPINLPRYLDRPQIMTRINENEFTLSEFDLWAEPLKDNVSWVIAQNLNTLLCADIVIFPWIGSQKINYRLTSTVIHLDGTLGGQAFLDVRWTLSEEQAKKVLITKKSRFTEPTGSKDYNALVSAYSRLLASFSREIADSFRYISQGRQHQ